MNLACTLYGLPKTRLEEVVEIINLKNAGKKKVDNFSMGMKQRLGLGMAIINHPKLLILDEPTNGLDPEDSTLGIINTIHENQLIIQIIDQGKGFSKKMLRHGKKQFTMDDGSRTKNKQHGLGLYIADNIIKKHNGEMTLRNNGDHGGVVIVTIPLEELKQII